VEPNHVETNTDPKSIRPAMPLECEQKLFPLGPGVHLEFGCVECLARRHPALEFRGGLPVHIMRIAA
jgi:hypothetical protein